MPVTPSHNYPGVYIQEIPSSVHTITGISTSITAFVGRTLRGPVNEPLLITGLADFERAFGGNWSAGSLWSVVRDFYTNGGSSAVIVRLYHVEANNKAHAILHADSLPLEAYSPGTWGNNLRVRVEASQAKDARARFGLDQKDLFTLIIYDANTRETETFRDLSVASGPQQVDKMLASRSHLVRVPDGTTLPQTPPKAHTLVPPKGKTIWESDDTSTGVAQADQASDGEALTSDDFIGDGLQAKKAGLYALEQTDIFNLLCIPPYNGSDVDTAVIAESASYCEQRRAMLLVDPPSSWIDTQAAIDGLNSDTGVGTSSPNAMLFFPRLKRAGALDDFVPCGAVAGVIARTDTLRGVWKAPAGLLDGILKGISEPAIRITNAENGELNPLAINCLRSMPPAGTVIWGARTLQGDDRLGSEWKYIPVRRLALYIEESLYRGTQWAVFEPNDETLWSQLRLNIGAFMNNLFRQGAFQGQTMKDAYFVQCDNLTTTQNDIDQGIVNILVGFAPLKPAEFVVLSLQQLAGQLAV